jgi:hypothetical protein
MIKDIYFMTQLQKLSFSAGKAEKSQGLLRIKLQKLTFCRKAIL